MDYKEKLENEISKRDLAQYAANLTLIYNYLKESMGSADPYNKQFAISSELDDTIKKLLSAMKEK